jgi:hypothetical protein
MMKTIIALASVLAIVALGSGPAAAAKHRTRHTVSCQQIKDALASGKSEEDVEKDLHVTEARMKQCTAPAKAHHPMPAPTK